jgi:xanthine/uracil/vitamin C permease (AzgA family)
MLLNRGSGVVGALSGVDFIYDEERSKCCIADGRHGFMWFARSVLFHVFVSFLPPLTTLVPNIAVLTNSSS